MTLLPKKPILIGWRETVGLASLGIKKIRAKIDTGARTSALHAYDISFEKEGLHNLVHFKVHPKRDNSTVFIQCRAPLVDKRRVRSSNGKVSVRPVIRAQMILGTVIKDIEITLINREQMDYRMLLGRAALKNDFRIDPSRSYLQSTRKKKKKKVSAE